MTRSISALAAPLRGKGPAVLLKRAGMIGRRYGLTSAKMVRALNQLSELLEAFDGRVTLPVTAVALARNRAVLQAYQARGIEFAVHGYTHVDYSQLAPDMQLAHMRLAREIFAAAGICAGGFRSPYLSRDAHLHSALEAAGFAYVSNQPIVWDVLDTKVFPGSAQAAYERALAFYKAWHASERSSLPRLGNRLVEIPVSLPDDEMLLDRLGGESRGSVEAAWREILAETHQRGELFTIQLHPERTALCADGLRSVLAEARELTPSVWLAGLGEIAEWWRSRAKTVIQVSDAACGGLHLTVTGPKDLTLLAHAVKVNAPTTPWADGYQKVESTTFTIRASFRPFIGVSPITSLQLVDFLRNQGYIVEKSRESCLYACYFDQADFVPEGERALLAQIEKLDCPLVRLGCWPNGARSALAVTGDVDALTLWDYGLRFFGR
jgi:peptidoglycan/xylan/chitin deacetylase (PgdA/CDA1 family)